MHDIAEQRWALHSRHLLLVCDVFFMLVQILHLWRLSVLILERLPGKAGASFACFGLEAAAKRQRWSRGHKARGQGHKKHPKPRPAFPRTDTLEAKDRNARGQGQGPRTQAQVLSKKKKKKVFTKIFQAIFIKKCFPKNFSSAPQNFNNSKNSAVLEPRTGQFSRT